MSHDEFTKLFKYIERIYARLEKHAEASRKEHANIYGAVADLVGQIKDYHQEMIMLTRQVDRMERWIHQIAKETGVKLSFE